MLRCDKVRKAGGYRDMGWPEDYDLWLRMFKESQICRSARNIILLETLARSRGIMQLAN